MRITLVSDPQLVNSNYRGYQPLQVLSRQGHEVLLNRVGEPRFDAGSLLRSDVVLIHRYCDPEIQRLAEHARAGGVAVVWDDDDDLTAIPRSNPHYKRYSGAAGRRFAAELTKMVRTANVVTTPSEHLADRLRAAGASDVRVLENYLPPEFSAVKPRAHDGVTIVWLAGLEHQLDYQQLRLRETLQQLLDAHSDLRVLSIGLGLGLQSDRYEHLRQVDFLDLARTMAVGDIGIAPLCDIPWNQARSNIKLKEYAAAGLPWLASPVGAYRDMGEQQGGRLVADDCWHDALGQLITDARARRKLAKRAAKWAKGESILGHARRWEHVFEDAHAHVRSAAA